MLPTQPLFAGGAMNPTAGMAMNPLLQGFGAYQNMQNDFTDRGLNQQSQDISNQTAQHSLEQSRLDDPNLAAQRAVTGGNIGIQKQLQDSGQMLEGAQAELSAKTQRALTSMSSDKLEVVKNAGAAYVAADEFAKNNPEAQMPGTPAHNHMLGILKDAGVKNVPDAADPTAMAMISSRAKAAPQTLQFIQQTQLEKQKTDSAEKIAAGHNVATIQAAQVGGLNNFLSALWRMPDNQRTLDLVKAAANQQVDSEGKNYITPSQAFAVEQVIRENPSPEDQKRAQQAHDDMLTTARNMGKDTLFKQAEEMGIPTKDKKGNEVDRSLLATKVADQAQSDFIEGRVKARVKASLPYPVKDLPEAKLNMPTSTTPAVPGQPIPTGGADVRGAIVPQPTPAQAAGKPASAYPDGARVFKNGDPKQPGHLVNGKFVPE